MKSRDGVLGYVAGGLGNQLFILAAAWAQAKRLGVALYLDLSHHGAKGSWAYALGDLNFPGVVLTSKSPWRSVRTPGGRVLPFPRDPRALRRVYVEKDDTRFDPAINSILPGTSMFGYFQSERYFESIKAEVRRMILSAPETPREAEYLAGLASEKRIAVHLRRGDYLLAPADRRLIASTDYALRARQVLAALGHDYPLRVFSDSPELVRAELAGVDADVEFADEEGLLTPINTIKAMASAEALVMSNSSFSWWAAWLLQEERGPSATVVAPRPWNESGTAKADMLKREWLSLDGR